ncbi:MAG: sigma-70 family RNA polymerase sigma factor [Sphingobacteriales bacterium]|nr:MAG: sigma-70 family RNA polymerase sigma factor [Sphingobacteriales bacterium]
MASINEITLAAQCAKGNSMAQRQVYEIYAQPMMLVCNRYITDVHDAQEVLSDGFYNFYKGIGSFTYVGEGSMKAWLKKIMVNQCLMHLRKKKMVFADTEIAEQVAVNEEVLAKLSAKEILQQVRKLPDGYRTVFNLYLFDGKTHAEIAAMLSISESTSKSQLHKAKAWLQKEIGKF